MIALLGLLVINLPFMDGLAVGTILAVLMVLAGAVTLLPAMLGFAGHAIDKLRMPGLTVRQAARRWGGRGFWYRWSRTVQRHPWTCGTAALAVLVVLAIPLFSMHQAFSDAGNDPVKLTTRQAYDMLSDGFGPGFNGPLIVAAKLPGPRCGRHRRHSSRRRIRGTADVASVTPPGPGHALATRRSSSSTRRRRHRPPRPRRWSRTLRGQVIPQATAGTGRDRLRGWRDRRPASTPPPTWPGGCRG